MTNIDGGAQCVAYMTKSDYDRWVNGEIKLDLGRDMLIPNREFPDGKDISFFDDGILTHKDFFETYNPSEELIVSYFTADSEYFGAYVVRFVFYVDTYDSEDDIDWCGYGTNDTEDIFWPFIPEEERLPIGEPDRLKAVGKYFRDELIRHAFYHGQAEGDHPILGFWRYIP